MTTFFGTSTSSSATTMIGYGGLNVVMMPRVVDLPVYAGVGSPVWGTGKDLVLDPVHIHDTNLFYRSLGFSWPFRGITKGMLMRAYQERNGAADERMTYAFKMLLNKDLRRLYDRIPLGQQMLDKYIIEMIRRKANAVAAEAAARGQDKWLQDIYEEWGLEADTSDTTEPIEPVGDADEPFGDEDQDDPIVSESDDSVPDTWSWGYWRWRSSCDDTVRLARWHRLLLSAARERGLRAQLGMGFIGAIPSAWKIAQLDNCYVIFLREGIEPEEGMAAAAVSEVIEMITLHDT